MTDTTSKPRAPKKRNRIPGLPHAQLEELYPGGYTFRDEANAIVARAFRNGPLEDLHAGKAVPIPEGVSRITQEEMKALMIHASRVIEELLQSKYYAPQAYWAEQLRYGTWYCRQWHRTASEDRAWERETKDRTSARGRKGS